MHVLIVGPERGCARGQFVRLCLARKPSRACKQEAVATVGRGAREHDLGVKRGLGLGAGRVDQGPCFLV